MGLRSVICIWILALTASKVAVASKAVSAKEFFPGPGDRRKVIYIETGDDETLIFDASDNRSYILDGAALEIRADHIEVRGKVIVSSFSEGAHGEDISGVAAKGDDGKPGPDGHGDGVGGGRGERGGRGGTGKPGKPGRSAKSITILVSDLKLSGTDSQLLIDASGEKGGKGQTGGQGGTGGRGGAGQDRVCSGDGPGNAGPRGAAGAQGTGGQGGAGGNGGDVILGDSVYKLRESGVSIVNRGGKGGDPGDPGQLGLPGEPGRAGAGGGDSLRAAAEEMHTMWIRFRQMPMFLHHRQKTEPTAN